MLGAALSRYWWMVLLRGLLAIAFGIAAFGLPGLTLAALVMLFAAFAFVEGLFAIFHAIGARRSEESWWLLLLEGLMGVAFGLLAFFKPGITTLLLLLYIGGWAIVTGALRVGTAVRLRREIQGEGWLAFGGIMSILFGVIVFAAPAAGALALVFWIGAWAILEGITLCVLAFKLARLRRETRSTFDEGVRVRRTFDTQAPAH